MKCDGCPALTCELNEGNCLLGNDTKKHGTDDGCTLTACTVVKLLKEYGNAEIQNNR